MSVHQSAFALQVNGDPNFVSQNVQLTGPGDVIGINPRVIVRTEPRRWVADFEPNYLAFIEFYEEDFPWRFTPARAVQAERGGKPGRNPQQTKLRPWIFLLVLAEGEFEEVSGLSGPLPVIRLAETTDKTVRSCRLPLKPGPGRTCMSARISPPQAPTRQDRPWIPSKTCCARTRIMPFRAWSARASSTPTTAYHAFLIPVVRGGPAGRPQPTYHRFRRAGALLGGRAVGLPLLLPMDISSTGERGDFEYLVNLLEPREVDERVGIREMDMQHPNFGASGMSTGPGDVPVMGLEGALKNPNAKSKPPSGRPKTGSTFRLS